MDRTQARDYLELGLHRIEQKRTRWDRREAYYRGQQDLPYAPEGVNAEYLSLREMALANWLALAMDTPIQRLRAEGFRTGRDGAADQRAWNEIWQPNNLDSRQRIPYTDMVLHGRGLMSVWPNPANKKTPVVRPENGRRVHLEPDPDDPWSTKWVVKTTTREDSPPSRVILPNGVSGAGATQVAWVYDGRTWVRFERTGGTSPSAQAWKVADDGNHPMLEPPFVAFDNRPNADGVPQSAIEPLMPAQDAINTIRFQTLLAMQFSAYRQRLVTGFDPVIRDSNGDPVWRTGDDGQPLLDAQGRPIPQVSTPGRVGVDRLLAFPGTETKVFDLPESNLDNYIKVLGEFLQDLFAVGQVPPQYLLNRMANLSGDALAGAESTLQSLVTDLQRAAGESLEQVMRLGNRARGEAEEDLSAEVIWADAEAKSFAQLVDGVTKLVSTAGFPRRAGWEMLPGATPQKVDRWESLAEQEAEKAAQRDPAAALKVAAEGLRATDAPTSRSAPPADDEVSLPASTPTAPGLPVSRRNGVAAAAR